MLSILSQISYKTHLILALILRIVLIFYGEYQDQISELPYTDVDYRVFTDASRHVLNGSSPYERHTYRYSPLLAIILTPNIFLHGIFGKILFSIVDIFVGLLIFSLVKFNRTNYNLGKKEPPEISVQKISPQNYEKTSKIHQRKIQKNDKNWEKNVENSPFKDFENISKKSSSIKFSKKETGNPYEKNKGSFPQKTNSKKGTANFLKFSKNNSAVPIYCMCFWLYNPMSFIISTRGNSDSLAVFLVLLTLYYLEVKKNFWVAGLTHGLAVHFRLYPIIYSLSYFMSLSNFSRFDCGKNFLSGNDLEKIDFKKTSVKADDFVKMPKKSEDNLIIISGKSDGLEKSGDSKEISEKTDFRKKRSNLNKSDDLKQISGKLDHMQHISEKTIEKNSKEISDDLRKLSLKSSNQEMSKQHRTIFKKEYLYYLVPNIDQLKLIFGTFLTLGTFTALFYILYGYEFLYETYIYHFIRKDTRHNFSLFFYIQYLTANVKNVGMWQKVLCSLPQLILLLVLSVRYGLNRFTLNFSIVTQTVVMVTYNSVLTSQYFVWIFGMLPLILWQLDMSIKKGIIMFLGWFVAQLAWLLPAYLLEFLGQNTFLFIWIQSLSFFCANMAVLGRLIKHFMYKVD